MMEITGIWLRREGDRACVLFEHDGKWYRAIREHIDGPFSHIIEELGIANCALDEVTAPDKEE